MVFLQNLTEALESRLGSIQKCIEESDQTVRNVQIIAT